MSARAYRKGAPSSSTTETISGATSNFAGSGSRADGKPIAPQDAQNAGKASDEELGKLAIVGDLEKCQVSQHLIADKVRFAGQLVQGNQKSDTKPRGDSHLVQAALRNAAVSIVGDSAKTIIAVRVEAKEICMED